MVLNHVRRLITRAMWIMTESEACIITQPERVAGVGLAYKCQMQRKLSANCSYSSVTLQAAKLVIPVPDGRLCDHPATVTSSYQEETEVVAFLREPGQEVVL